MDDDPRCCGSGTCIIDEHGQCWCGQRWDGQAMCPPAPASSQADPQAKAPAGAWPGTPGAGAAPDA